MITLFSSSCYVLAYLAVSYAASLVIGRQFAKVNG